MSTLDFQAVVNALQAQGFWHGEAVLPKALTENLLAELQTRRAQKQLQRAGVGRAQQFQLDDATRRDSIYWLDGASVAQRDYLQLMDELRLYLNQNLFLGLHDFETHFAHYPPGSFYKKHKDSFVGAKNRTVSVVAYLNPLWALDDGGELALYDAEDCELARVLPVGGSLVVFMSEEIPHEVLTTQKDRYSIAGWFRIKADNNLW